MISTQIYENGERSNERKSTGNGKAMIMFLLLAIIVIAAAGYVATQPAQAVQTAQECVKYVAGAAQKCVTK